MGWMMREVVLVEYVCPECAQVRVCEFHPGEEQPGRIRYRHESAKAAAEVGSVCAVMMEKRVD